MKTKIIYEKNNPVLKRKEIKIEITHEKGGTPDRIAIRDFLASQLKEKPQNLYIIKVEGKTGSDSSVCQAEIYESKEFADEILPKYISRRNLPPDKRETKKSKAKPEETKKEKPEPKEESKAKPEETKKEKPEPKEESKAKPEETKKEKPKLAKTTEKGKTKK